MSSDKPENETNDQFEFLFGRPALLEGEDEERYLHLRATAVDELKPKTVFEWVNVKDHVDKLWEEQRYKRASTALINGGFFKALEYYLKEIFDGPYADELTFKYFNGHAKGKKEVLSALTEKGITMAELQAKAAQLESGGLAMFDRMVAARESGVACFARRPSVIPARAAIPTNPPNRRSASMATEKQISANRANAQKSTGSKTAAGRLKSSRNALRHGLSLPLPFGTMTAKADAIARLLASEQAEPDQLAAATEVAQAQMELLRIRAIRAEMTAQVDLGSADVDTLRRLAALDPYERLALTKRRRASQKL